jgi:phage shock protein A
VCKELRRRAELAEERAARAEDDAREALRAKIRAENELNGLRTEIDKLTAEKARLSGLVNGLGKTYEQSAKGRAARESGKPKRPIRNRPVSELFIGKQPTL